MLIDHYVPTLQAPGPDSPAWYVSFHSSFYMCQLVNNVLLSYMKTSGNAAQQAIIDLHNEVLLKDGAIRRRADGSFEIIDHERVYSFDVEDFLHQHIEDFAQSARRIKHNLFSMGIEASGYVERCVAVDLPAILKSSGAVHWYAAVKGFLNVWEFLFLFGIAEPTLKQIHSKLAEKAAPTLELVSSLNNRCSGLVQLMENEHGITADLANSIWKLFTSVRNVYAHKHGMIAETDENDILRRADEFRKHYANCFLSPDNPSSWLLSRLIEEPGQFFPKNRFQSGAFFFLQDHELNVFRNFISEYMAGAARLNLE